MEFSIDSLHWSRWRCTWLKVDESGQEQEQEKEQKEQEEEKEQEQEKNQ